MLKRCLVIGSPVKHSKSPLIHNFWYKELCLDREFYYDRHEVLPEQLTNFVEDLKSSNTQGVSVTVPHKVEIIKYLDEIDETARQVGAVNTVVAENGKLYGYNTDWYGFLKPLETQNLQGKNVAVLGAGGASRAVVYALLTQGCKVTIFNRTLQKAVNLSKSFENVGVVKPKELLSNLNLSEFEIIVNTTSAYLNNQSLDLNPDNFQATQTVYDISYGKSAESFLAVSKDKGATVIDGKTMLIYQASKQFELFTKYELSAEVIQKALKIIS